MSKLLILEGKGYVYKISNWIKSKVGEVVYIKRMYYGSFCMYLYFCFYLVRFVGKIENRKKGGNGN